MTYSDMDETPKDTGAVVGEDGEISRPCVGLCALYVVGGRVGGGRATEAMAKGNELQWLSICG